MTGGAGIAGEAKGLLEHHLEKISEEAETRRFRQSPQLSRHCENIAAGILCAESGQRLIVLAPLYL